MIDVLKNIEKGKYEVKMSFPKMPGWICDCGHFYQKDDKFCSNCGAIIAGLYKKQQKKYKEKRDAYHKAEWIKFKEFENDLYKEFQVENNPKKEDCFRIAWGYGHDSGLNSVYEYFFDLVDLIK